MTEKIKPYRLRHPEFGWRGRIHAMTPTEAAAHNAGMPTWSKLRWEESPMPVIFQRGQRVYWIKETNTKDGKRTVRIEAEFIVGNNEWATIRVNGVTMGAPTNELKERK